MRRYTIRACTFCPSQTANTGDHIPPRRFFDDPPPPNLIKVPCCEECRLKDQQHDRLMRNLFISFLETEGHRSVEKELAKRREQSLREDAQMLPRLLQFMTVANIIVEGRIVGKAPAFNLQHPLVDRFLERICRGVIYDAHKVSYFPAKFNWVLQPRFPGDLLQRAEASIKQRGIGDIFHYFPTQRADRGWFVLLTFFEKLQILGRLDPL